MQYRNPVGLGPSSKTCPRCASHLLHKTSTRRIPWLKSVSVVTFSAATGAQKLGHPVPDSNFVSELNSLFPQQTQRYIPLSCRSWYLPVNAGSVPLLRAT